jgi:hypothetical protein
VLLGHLDGGDQVASGDVGLAFVRGTGWVESQEPSVGRTISRCWWD